MGKLTGLLPLMEVRSPLTGRRLISLPFSYICGPLAEGAGELHQLLMEATRLAQEEKCRYLEIKRLEPLPGDSEKDFCKTDHYKTFLLNLEASSGELWSGLHRSSTQRSIEKAQREGIRILFADGYGHWENFFRLNLRTSRTHGVPSQPLRFFRNIFQEMQPEKLAQLVLAFKGTTPVAGAVFFLYQKRVVYMYGASHPDYLQYRPNHLILWETIGWAQASGFKIFDFGRVSPENAGLAQFKARWGAREHPLYSYFWPSPGGVGLIDRTGWKYRLATGFMRKLPMPLYRNLSVFYKHLS